MKRVVVLLSEANPEDLDPFIKSGGNGLAMYS